MANLSCISWSDMWNSDSGLYVFFSFIASIVTIGGALVIVQYLRKRQISKNCQKKIIMDLIRHLFVNCIIIEVIRTTLIKNKFTLRPADGVLSRFSFLESDTNLERFSINSRNFDYIHRVSLYMRNYNIAAIYCEKHFSNPEYPDGLRIADLDELFCRAVGTTQSLIDLSRHMKLDIKAEAIKKYFIEDHKINKREIYNIHFNKEDIQDRNKFNLHSFYDGKNNSNKEFINECIMKKATSINFIDRNIK